MTSFTRPPADAPIHEYPERWGQLTRGVHVVVSFTARPDQTFCCAVDSIDGDELTCTVHRWPAGIPAGFTGQALVVDRGAVWDVHPAGHDDPDDDQVDLTDDLHGWQGAREE